MITCPFRKERGITLTNLSLLFLMFACKPQISNHAKTAPNHEGAFVPVIREFTLEHHERTERVYTLKAHEARIDNGQQRAFVSSPFLALYVRGKNAINVEAEAKTGVVHLDSKDIILEGNVVYRVIPRKTTLFTQKLIYWAKREETEVPEGTGYRLQTPTGLLEGSGMISKEDLTQ